MIGAWINALAAADIGHTARSVAVIMAGMSHAMELKGSASDIAKAAGIHRSTAFRALGALSEAGLIASTDEGYRLVADVRQPNEESQQRDKSVAPERQPVAPARQEDEMCRSSATNVSQQCDPPTPPFKVPQHTEGETRAPAGDSLQDLRRAIGTELPDDFTPIDHWTWPTEGDLSLIPRENRANPDTIRAIVRGAGVKPQNLDQFVRFLIRFWPQTIIAKAADTSRRHANSRDRLIEFRERLQHYATPPRRELRRTERPERVPSPYATPEQEAST